MTKVVKTPATQGTPRAIAAPADFAEALAADPTAGRAFAALPPSHKREHLKAIEAAKAPETRARRIAKAIAMLRTPRA